MCLHASRSRIAQTACFAQCTSQCTATKRCKYHSIGVFFGQLTQIQELFFRFLTILVKTRGIVSWPCSVAFTVACTVRALYVHCSVHCACTVRALCVHCTCTVHNRMVCVPLYFHQRSASILLSCEGDSAFGLGFWQVHNGLYSSLCLHIHKRKNIPVASLFVGSSFEDVSFFGFRFW